jgi:hypothetical protein
MKGDITRPDTRTILAGLKDFQRETVAYVFERLFDRHERRLELFEAWINSAPAVFSERAPSPTAGGPHSPPGPVDSQGQVERSLFTAQAS